MFRSWPIWLTLLLIAASLGYYWLLSSDLTFVRVEQPPKPAVVKPK